MASKGICTHTTEQLDSDDERRQPLSWWRQAPRACKLDAEELVAGRHSRILARTAAHISPVSASSNYYSEAMSNASEKSSVAAGSESSTTSEFRSVSRYQAAIDHLDSSASVGPGRKEAWLTGVKNARQRGTESSNGPWDVMRSHMNQMQFSSDLTAVRDVQSRNQDSTRVLQDKSAQDKAANGVTSGILPGKLRSYRLAPGCLLRK